MTFKVRKLINELADRIRIAYEIPTPIDDMDDVVNQIGGVVEYSEYLQFDGRITKATGSAYQFIISLPEKNSELRNRFTIAHELGHLFLHMGYAIDEAKWGRINPDEIYNRDNGINEREYQANEFAAAFLMPQNEFKLKLTELAIEGKVPMDKVAEYFDVSVEAAVNRGKWLGYLAW